MNDLNWKNPEKGIWTSAWAGYQLRAEKTPRGTWSYTVCDEDSAPVGSGTKGYRTEAQQAALNEALRHRGNRMDALTERFEALGFKGAMYHARDGMVWLREADAVAILNQLEMRKVLEGAK